MDQSTLKRLVLPAGCAILLFTVAGPLIGSLPFAILFAVVGSHLSDALPPLAFGIPLGLPLAFTAGCLFALCNGLSKGKAAGSPLAATATGAAAGFLAVTLAAAILQIIQPSNPPSHSADGARAFFHFTSTISGMGCGAMFVRCRRCRQRKTVEQISEA